MLQFIIKLKTSINYTKLHKHKFIALYIKKKYIIYIYNFILFVNYDIIVKEDLQIKIKFKNLNI